MALEKSPGPDSVTATSERRRYDLNTPLPELIEAAVRAEVSLFTPQQVRIAPGCLACMGRGDGGQGDYACGIVGGLAQEPTGETAAYPSVCGAGRSVHLHSLENGGGCVLVVDSPEPVDNGAADERLEAIGALQERCEHLVGQTDGLAQEVLRSYEQLNVIFDVTQYICKSRDAGQIKHFLLQRMAQTLDCEWSCCLSFTDGVLWWCGDGKVDRDETVARLQAEHTAHLYQSTDHRRPLVFNRGSGGALAATHSLLMGALGEAGAAPDVMVFARAADRAPFISGDMMMVDSMLNHAQHVLSNLKLVERLRSMSLGAVRALVSAIDKKDHYTSGHSERVGFLSHMIGRQMALTPEQLQDLEWGGLLHDVGKIGIEDGILSKPGGLTPEEFDIIKQHVVMSYEIVAPIECMAGVGDIVLYHHEVPDGTGYPKGLKGDETPLLARIVHVADTFDALTTSRSYRKAFSLDKALDIMRKESGTKLDAEITGAFFEAFDTFRRQQPDRYRQLFPHLEEDPS